MKRSLLIFSLCLIVGTMALHANDMIDVQQDSASAPTRYELKVEKRRQLWAALIPTHFVIQNAGNMGLLSAGIGWDYARHWETQLLFGFIPKHQSSRAKLTMTLKENYIPWKISLTGPHTSTGGPVLKRGWSFNPLTVGLYLNTVFGHEFWKSQPIRYPNRYYEFMSTEYRVNIALGQRFTWQVPYERRNRSSSVSLFYEVSTCDIYIRSKILDHGIPFKDLFGLSLGLKIQGM